MTVMQNPAYVLSITSAGGIVPTVTFNGWTAYRKRAPEWHQSTCATRKLNAWWLEGRNVLSVTVPPPSPLPDDPPRAAASDMLRVWVYKAEHGRNPEVDPEITLLDYRWDPAF